MRIAIIGRTETLYETALHLRKLGHEIVLIITSKEAPEYSRTAADFQVLAGAWGVQFLHAPKISNKVIETVRNIKEIEVGVSINYTGIIPQTMINLFPHGILNAHGGDLPRYRGNACQAWAIINGEDKVGLCIHRMVGDELDTGDIMARDYFPLSQHTKITAVYQWMNDRIPNLFTDALNHLSENSNYVLEHQSKREVESLRCYPRRPEDGEIIWSKSAVEIVRLINACNKPYSGAYCFLEAQKLIIWDAELAAEEKFLAVPGQITLVGDGYVEVAASDGKIRLNTIEVSGSRKTSDELIHSIRQRLT